MHQALTERHDMLLYDAEPLVASAEEYLLTRYSVRRVEATVVYRRRVEVVSEIEFLIQTDDFPAVIAKLERFGGRAERISADDRTVRFRLSSGTCSLSDARGSFWLAF